MRNPRFDQSAYFVWALAVCPVLAWLVTVVLVGDTDPEALSWALLFGIPAFLTIVGGLIAQRPFEEIALATFGSMALAGVTWVITLISIF
jgi:predicted PurR-regulated permease PerM